MRTFFATTLLTLTLLVGGFGTQVGVAHAQCTDGTSNCGTPAGSGSGQNTGSSGQGAGNAQTAAPAGANQPTNPSVSGWDTFFGDIITPIVQIFAWFLGVAAITLDNAVYYTVVHLGGGSGLLPNGINGISAIGVAWRILRDVANIVLIFGFLAMGISIIVEAEWYGGGTTMLPKLLIAALLINFSIFISEAVIDVSDVFATQIYTALAGGQISTPGISITQVSQEGISSRIMGNLGLTSFYNFSAAANTGQSQADLLGHNHPLLVGFLAIFLFTIATFVFFSLALILIARFVRLVFLIVVAPVGFASAAVPQLESLGGWWWSELIGQSITAPILLLLLYVAIAVITDTNFLKAFGASNSGFTAGIVDPGSISSLAGIMLSFGIAMGLLLFVTIAASKLSAYGAGWATKTAGKLTGGLIGTGLAGGISLAGRGTLGLTGRLLNNKKMQARASRGGALGLLNKAGAWTGRQLENRTYDFRNVKTLGAIAGAAASAAGSTGSGFDEVDVGHGATVTAKTAVDKTFKAVKTYKPFSGEWWRDQQKEYEKAASELERKNVFGGNTKAEIKKALKKMSADEIADLKKIREADVTFVTSLTGAAYAELQKSTKLLAGEKKNIKDAWDAQFNAANAATTLASLTPEEITGLGGDTLSKKEVALALKEADLGALQTKGNLTREQRRKIHNELNTDPATTATYNAYLNADATGGRKNYWNV